MSGTAWIEFEINFQFLGCVGEHGERLLLIAMLVSSSTLSSTGRCTRFDLGTLRHSAALDKRKKYRNNKGRRVPAWILS